MALRLTIGVGLFLGSASVIKLAGRPPSCSPMYWAESRSSSLCALSAKWPYISRLRAPLAAMRKTILVPLPGYLTGWNYWDAGQTK